MTPITIEQNIIPYSSEEEEGLDYDNPLLVTIHIDSERTGATLYLGEKAYDALAFVELGKIIDRNIA